MDYDLQTWYGLLGSASGMANSEAAMQRRQSVNWPLAVLVLRWLALRMRIVRTC